MAIRRVRAIWGLCFCLVLGQHGLAFGQLGYDRMHLAQSSAPSLMSYGTQAHDRSREALKHLPADYFATEQDRAAETKPGATVQDSKRGRRYGNLVVLACLAVSFGLGLVITLTTIRRQSATAPRPLF